MCIHKIEPDIEGCILTRRGLLAKQIKEGSILQMGPE